MSPINPSARYSPPPDLTWTELQAKNNATHIPPEEFEELASFLKTHSPEMATAVEEGSLFEKTELDLSSKELTELPSSLKYLTNLTLLNVYDNQLTDLPDTIGQLTNLTELNVSGNTLTALPDTVGQLTNLTLLYMYSNDLAVLPDTIGQLTNLTEIHAYYNQLTALPNTIGQLTNLTEIHARGTQLTALPNTIGQLTNLTLLDVSENQLTDLPDTIGQLTNLTLLYIHYNELVALPDTIGQLANLTELHAHYNQLTVLPNTIGQLTNLTALPLSYNQLTAFPETIGQLTSLTHLSVYNNQLTALPSSIGDLNLLGMLEICSNPSLSILPISLGNCSQLTYLNIQGTSIYRSNRDQILTACRNMRNLEAFEKLPHKIKLWRGFTDVVGEWTDPEFTREQKGNLYEWLFRLEKASDFKRNQKELAETTCAILETVHTDAKFRETFFNLIVGDLAACGDRAAMSLNLVYTDWKLYTLPAEAPLSEKVQLLIGCGRALKLRQAVLSRYSGYENVEKVLYAEVNLRERLALVTAITSMIYSEIGNIEDSVIEDIAQEIEAVSDAELVVEFAYWENYLKEHHTLDFFRIVSRIQAASGGLLKRSGCENITDEEYREQEKVLQTQKQEAILQLTQKIIDGIQQSEAIAQS
ncbi:MAG: E3 ubiquitin-protein ligase SspH2 [Chlamydiales bacterium]|nr:E3 ubiquitin-protein ligase SspH2 [Chlamydiales bacterium]